MEKVLVLENYKPIVFSRKIRFSPQKVFYLDTFITKIQNYNKVVISNNIILYNQLVSLLGSSRVIWNKYDCKNCEKVILLVSFKPNKIPKLSQVFIWSGDLHLIRL